MILSKELRGMVLMLTCSYSNSDRPLNFDITYEHLRISFAHIINSPYWQMAHFFWKFYYLHTQIREDKIDDL